MNYGTWGMARTLTHSFGPCVVVRLACDVLAVSSVSAARSPAWQRGGGARVPAHRGGPLRQRRAGDPLRPRQGPETLESQGAPCLCAGTGSAREPEVAVDGVFALLHDFVFAFIMRFVVVGVFFYRFFMFSDTM